MGQSMYLSLYTNHILNNKLGVITILMKSMSLQFYRTGIQVHNHAILMVMAQVELNNFAPGPHFFFVLNLSNRNRTVQTRELPMKDDSREQGLRLGIIG